jgi:AmmeMemoRadiSam system protein B
MELTKPVVRPAAVAGSFYPGNAPDLAAQVDGFVAAAAGDSRPAKALIVPHAGYVYSGATAGRAYARLRPYATTIRRVVLFGPAHRVAVHGLAAPAATAFSTPLGNVKVDSAAIEAACRLPQVRINEAAHAAEHSLEVQLPFLQRLFADFTIAPFVVGQTGDLAIAAVIEALWGGDETLVVVSSDLSHYLTYAEARTLDRDTADAIRRREPLRRFEQACGALPINALLEIARRHGLSVEEIDLCNSGDMAGDRNRVVGYGAFAFYES